jgi:carboxylesterase type B
MISEGVFVAGSMTMALKLSSPVYFYLFDYEQEFSFNKVYGQCQKHLGVSHGDEMISLFPLKSLIPKELNENDSKVSKLMVDIWVKFASSR